MTLTLTYTAKTNIPVELEGVTPAALREKSPAEIERLTIHHGNREEKLAAFFTLAGDAADEHIVFEGDLSGVHWIGAKMQTGRIDVRGHAGRHVGSEMTGGEIHVDGNAGDWAGGEMRGGLIHVRGDAGDLVGAAYRGSPRGMTGGTLLVDGRAGDEIGTSMRRGLIAIGGDAGDFLAHSMLAGSIFVFGEIGIRPGAEMSRGTIALLGAQPPQLLPSFRYGCRFAPPMFRLLQPHLQALDFPQAGRLAEHREVRLFQGDLVSLGRGEILLPARERRGKAL